MSKFVFLIIFTILGCASSTTNYNNTIPYTPHDRERIINDRGKTVGYAFTEKDGTKRITNDRLKTLYYIK